MSASTLVARVARAQTAVVAVALVLVLAGTFSLVHQLLAWKTDQQLVSVLERSANYLGASPGGDMDWRWFAGEVEEVRPSDVRVEVWDLQGRLRSAAGPGRALVVRDGTCTSGGPVRTCALPRAGFTVRAARNVEDDRAVEWQVAGALLAACLLVGAGVALTGRRVTRKAVQPLTELTARVEAVEPGSGERVGFKSDLAELDALGRRFDELIGRFEEALAREKRFSAEASHELRTPLTIARAELEELSAGPNADQATLGRAIASIDRLSALVDALLWFARAQGRLDAQQLEVVNVADLIRAEIGALQRTTPRQTSDTELPDEALVRGDEELLRRAIANLLENAAKHGDRAPVRVRLARIERCLELSVANGGRAIPLEVREEIFEPFFRYRRDRPDATGFGLGLPFARAVARSHGGDVEHGASRPDEVEMLLTLPLVDWNDA